MDITTFIEQPEDIPNNDRFGYVEPDAFRNVKDIETEEFLTKFYKGEVSGQYMCTRCERACEKIFNSNDDGVCEHCFNDDIDRAENAFDVARDEGRI